MVAWLPFVHARIPLAWCLELTFVVWLGSPLPSLQSPFFCVTSCGNGNKSEINDDLQLMKFLWEIRMVFMVFIHGVDDIATVLKLCTQQYSELKTLVLNGQSGFATSAKGGRAILACLYSP